MPAASAPREVDGAFVDELARLIATAPVNLVSRRDRTDVRGVHVDECLRVASHLRVHEGQRWLDLGTGGGLPGLVLAAAFPGVRWTLVDARAKKIALVRHFADVLNLPNVRTLHARAEDLVRDDHVGAYDGVVSRAIGSLERTVVLARPFITTGDVMAIRGPGVSADVAAGAALCSDIGLVVDAVTEISGTIRPTWLVRLRGQGPVPTDFPRIQRALLRGTPWRTQ